MQLKDIYKSGQTPISFEVFPPKTPEGIDNLIQELKILANFKPAFISVTYGAGGTTQGRSITLLERIRKELNLNILAHLTCIGSSPESILKFLNIISGLGIENVLALRGDHPKNNLDYHPESNVFKYAVDLVKFTHEHCQMDVSVAGYPLPHPETPDQEKDIDYLKQKVDAGASAVITQLFFENDKFLRFRDLAVKKGIKIPIVPGIMPITAKVQLQKIPELCGNLEIIPRVLSEKIAKAKDDAEAKQIGTEQAIQQVVGLQKEGVAGFHFYPLNKASSVLPILTGVNL